MQESSRSANEKDTIVPSDGAPQHEHEKHLSENQDYDYFIGKVNIGYKTDCTAFCGHRD